MITAGCIADFDNWKSMGSSGIECTVKERELTAILKLLCHTVKNYPGVFYRGKGHAVLPILGRIVPLFAEPELRLDAHHGGLCSLGGDRFLLHYCCDISDRTSRWLSRVILHQSKSKLWSSDIVVNISSILKKSWCFLCSSLHDSLFDTLYSLVALLKSGELETYRQLFIGAMLLVEGISEEVTHPLTFLVR